MSTILRLLPVILGGVASVKQGFTAYTLTESGLSYGVTYQTRRFTPIGSLNAE